MLLLRRSVRHSPRLLASGRPSPSSSLAATVTAADTKARPRGPSVDDLRERRRRAGRLVVTTAAYVDSENFQGPSTGKPLARRWDNHISAESRVREPCALKKAARHLRKPGIISLGGGLPCAEYFPFESISAEVADPSRLPSPEAIRIGKHDVANSHDKVYDLSIALNYGQSIGSPQMLRWVTEHTEMVCNPPYADWRTCLTVGTTGATEQAFRLFLDKDRGDSLMTEEFSFATAVETATPLRVKVVGIKMDDQGLLPQSMDDILTNWDVQARGARKPHVLYTVPTGHNPTGATQGEQRRKDIYAVAQKHDIFILEDEPYYFLQMLSYGESRTTGTPTEQSTDEFLASIIPTLLSMDTDGRVLRMDSLSKTIAPGSRLGWVTGPAQIIERYIRHGESANQGPSGFSQAILHKLLDETWGHDGYLRWLMQLCDEYTSRRNTMLAACERYLPRDIVGWTTPAAGMFHWVKVDHTKHPDESLRRDILRLEENIFYRCIDNDVLVAQGSWFRAEHDKPPTGMFFRMTYAAASPQDMTEAVRRFGSAIRQEYRLA